MPLKLYDYGAWNLVGLNQDECSGVWAIDLESTSITVQENEEDKGNWEITAKCGFKRQFLPSGSDVKGELQTLRTRNEEEAEDEVNTRKPYNVMWRSGYNLYRDSSSVYRYAYGSSYESDMRIISGLNI
jgi:hypothetical protein